MARYTNVGPSLFDWPPYHALSFPSRCLWLGLYASAEAKRVLPGLFHGGRSVMAEAAAMSVIDVDSSLRELCDRRLVTHDPMSRLTAFLALPDRGERPCNGRSLKMFWARWRDLPEAYPKYHWVSLLSWLCEPMTTDHLNVWQTTFATVDTVKLTNSDTPHNALHPGSKLSTGSELSTGGASQQELFYSKSPTCETELSTGESDLSTGEPEIVRKDVVADTVRHTPRYRYVVSGIPEGGSGGISAGGHNGLDGPRGTNGIPLSFTVKDLCEVLEKSSEGRVLCGVIDPRSGPTLRDTVSTLEGLGMGLSEVDLAGRFLAAGGISYRTDLDAKWAGQPGNLVGVISQAKRWEKDGGADLRVTTKTPSPIVLAARGLTELGAWAETGYDPERREELVSERTIRAARAVGGVWELKHTSDVGRWRYQFAAAYAAEGEPDEG